MPGSHGPISPGWLLSWWLSCRLSWVLRCWLNCWLRWWLIDWLSCWFIDWPSCWLASSPHCGCPARAAKQVGGVCSLPGPGPPPWPPPPSARCCGAAEALCWRAEECWPGLARGAPGGAGWPPSTRAFSWAILCTCFTRSRRRLQPHLWGGGQGRRDGVPGCASATRVRACA